MVVSARRKQMINNNQSKPDFSKNRFKILYGIISVIFIVYAIRLFFLQIIQGTLFGSQAEENRIKKYADSIVVKTAYSYQRILDEAGLFLHLVEEKQKKKGEKTGGFENLGELRNILHNKTVLLADDDVRNIFSLTKALEIQGMKIIPAMDGKEALKILKENPSIDVVLMDMMMPEMDGYESIREIRTIPQFKNLPVLAVTSKAMMGDREKCIAVGASDYISKPVDIDQMVSLLRVWLYDKI